MTPCFVDCNSEPTRYWPHRSLRYTESMYFRDSCGSDDSSRSADRGRYLHLPRVSTLETGKPGACRMSRRYQKYPHVRVVTKNRFKKQSLAKIAKEQRPQRTQEWFV